MQDDSKLKELIKQLYSIYRDESDYLNYIEEMPNELKDLENETYHKKKYSRKSGDLNKYLDKNYPNLTFQEKTALKAFREDTSPEISSIVKDALANEDRLTLDRSSFPNIQDYSDNNSIYQKNRLMNRLSNKLNSLKKVSKGIPIIGTLVGGGIALASGEANAASALPVLGEADSLGPEQGSDDYIIENPQASPKLRLEALKRLKNR